MWWGELRRLRVVSKKEMWEQKWSKRRQLSAQGKRTEEMHAGR